MSAPPFAFGSDIYPGLAKLIEEAGEVQQVAGKLVMTGGRAEHWDGTDLRARLQEEIADLMAACRFVAEACGFDAVAVSDRAEQKLAQFRGWHQKRADSTMVVQDFEAVMEAVVQAGQTAAVLLPAGKQFFCIVGAAPVEGVDYTAFISGGMFLGQTFFPAHEPWPCQEMFSGFSWPRSGGLSDSGGTLPYAGQVDFNLLITNISSISNRFAIRILGKAWR